MLFNTVASGLDLSQFGKYLWLHFTPANPRHDDTL